MIYLAAVVSLFVILPPFNFMISLVFFGCAVYMQFSPTERYLDLIMKKRKYNWLDKLLRVPKPTNYTIRH